jgi:hypothetical protein
MSVGSVPHLQLPRIKIMNKQSYHKPELRMYGNISVMTQAMGSTSKQPDGPPRTTTRTS